ncbi:MAG: PAS domain S-box protein [Ignavibacteriae bacterium]|nr:PAS domain S-box protein [Ignavibacteriota bacterium]
MRTVTAIAPLVGGALVVCIAAFVLAGWIYGSRVLMSFGQDLLPMAPSTALLFMMNGAALILIVWRQGSNVVRVTALGVAIVALAGAGTLTVLSAQGLQSDIEHLGFPSSTMPDGMAIGHISSIAAGWLTASALALVILQLSRSKGRTGPVISLVLAATLFMSSQLLLIANLGGSPFGFGPSEIVPSLPTAIGLVLLSGGLLFASARILWPDMGMDPRRGGEFVFQSILVFLLLASCIFVIAFLQAVAELKVRDIAQYRRERLGDASLLMENPDISRLALGTLGSSPDGTSKRLLGNWMRKLREAYSYDRVFLLDPEGDMRLTPGEPDERIDTVIASRCASVLRSHTLHVEDLYRSDVDRKIYIALLIPVYDGNTPLAVFVLRIDPEVYLYPYLQTWPGPSRTSETLLVRRDGNSVVFLSPLRFSTDPPLTHRISLTHTEVPAVQAVLGERGSVEGIDYAGQEVIASIAPVPGSPWYLIARTSVSEAITPVRERLSLMLILIVILVGFAGLALAYFAVAQRARIFREQFQHAENMRRSDERFRKLVESARDGIVLTDATGTCTDANPGACTMFGLPHDRLVGQPFPSLFRLPDGSDGNPLWLSLIRADTRATELSLRRADGSCLSVDVSAWVLPDGNAQAIVRDITERKRAEELQQNLHLELEERVKVRTEQLETTNKELETFSYSVSHDLRAPLRGIDGWSLALLEDYGDTLEPRAKEFLDRVRSETQRMGHLIDDLLRLSRVTRTDMRSVPVDLTALVRRLGESIRISQPDRDTLLSVEDGLTVQGDPSLLEIAITNLLDNSFKFTSRVAPARITVGRQNGGGRNVFFVSDNGAGFDMAFAKKLFAPFQRMHTLSEFPGTGIGLAIVQRIIHRHGGAIWAESAVNAGATFYFTLEKGS